MSKIAVGIVGAGQIADEHLRTLSRCPGVGELCIYDVAGERAAALAAAWGARVARTLAELVDQCDLLWNCAPPFAHVEPIQKACRAGKAIFCEKPLALEAGQMRQIVKAVSGSGVPFFMGHSGRYVPAFQKMRQLVSDGAVGEPTRVWSSRMGYLAGPAATGWRLDDSRSGGVIIEFGIHELDFARWIGGEFVSLCARQSAHTLKPGAFTDTAVIVGELASGAIADIHVSWAQPRYEWRRGVQGTEGSLHYDDSTFNEVQWHRPGRKMKSVKVPPVYWQHPQTRENVSFMRQTRAIVKALRTGGGGAVNVEVGLEDGVASLKAALAARQSARSGRAVRL